MRCGVSEEGTGRLPLGGGLLRRYQIDFIQRLAPHLGKRVVERAAQADSQKAADALLEGIEIPVR